MKKLLKNSILTKENNYSKLDLLDSYLSAIFIDDLDHNFFLSLLNKLKPQGEIDFEYSQNWASLNAKYARNLEDKLTELEHLNNVINYSKEIGAKRWETLRAQIYKSYTLMDLNRFYVHVWVFTLTHHGYLEILVGCLCIHIKSISISQLSFFRNSMDFTGFQWISMIFNGFCTIFVCM